MDFIPGMEIEMRSQMEQLLASEGVANVVTALLLWREVTGRPEDYDVNEESGRDEGTVVPGRMEFRALFHQVDQRLSGFQRFLEVKTGDVILEYLADLPLQGKEDVRVMVKGKIYVQKNASTELLETWDTLSESGGLMKSLLLAPVG